MFNLTYICTCMYRTYVSICVFCLINIQNQTIWKSSFDRRRYDWNATVKTEHNYMYMYVCVDEYLNTDWMPDTNTRTHTFICRQINRTSSDDYKYNNIHNMQKYLHWK